MKFKQDSLYKKMCYLSDRICVLKQIHFFGMVSLYA